MRFNVTLFSLPFTALGAIQLANALGPLTPYLLNDCGLAAAGRSTSRPTLSSSIGCCFPIIGVRNSTWLRFLLPAIILPLQWQDTESAHDARLPPAITMCADQVIHELGIAGKQQFTLHFQEPDLDWPDLSGLLPDTVEAQSCFASLAAGLNSRLQNAPVNPRVWASGGWNDGPQEVELLENKLNAARLWNIRQFYVSQPQGNIDKLAEMYPEMELKRLAEGTNLGVHQWLAELLADSYLEPKSDDLSACIRYHALLRSQTRAKATLFYETRLFPLLASHIRTTIWKSPQLPKNLKLTHLVTIATSNPQPVLTLIAALEIQELILLCSAETPSMVAGAKTLLARCREYFPRLQFDGPTSFLYQPNSAQFPYDFSRSMSLSVRSRINQIPKSNLVFDLDRGSTLQKFVMLQNVIEDENVLVTLSHEWIESGGVPQIDHGSERIFLYTKTDNWSIASPLDHTSDEKLVPKRLTKTGE